MDRKTAETPRGIREVLESIPEEHFQSIWSCFYRPVLLHFTPAALAAGKKAAANRLSGQESLFEDEDQHDEGVVHQTVLHNILRCDRNGELAALIKEHQDWARKVCRRESYVPELCAACGRQRHEGLGPAARICLCGSAKWVKPPERLLQEKEQAQWFRQLLQRLD